jgi:heptosyltransferase-3
MAGLIKKKYPDSTIIFIGRSYTEPVVALSSSVDSFINWDKIENLPLSTQAQRIKDLCADWIIHVFPKKSISRAARMARIKNRVGTSHRVFHWLTCNRLIKFSRRKSELHEAQLNCKLLKPLGIDVPDQYELKKYYTFTVKEELREKFRPMLDKQKKNIVFHPKSKGSAREWGIRNFEKLIHILPEDDFRIFISGTSSEAELMKDLIKNNEHQIIDITGKFSLDEFIAFLSLVDGIVAASTGPLHLAAALGTCAIGIYPPIRPMHPGRWSPLGENAHVLVKEGFCELCRKNHDCRCMREISPEMVKQSILLYIK